MRRFLVIKSYSLPDSVIFTRLSVLTILLPPRPTPKSSDRLEKRRNPTSIFSSSSRLWMWLTVTVPVSFRGKNRLSRAVVEVRPGIQSHIAWLEQELNDLDAELGQTIRRSPVWREQDDLLRSVPGVVVRRPTGAPEAVSVRLVVVRA